MYREHKQLHLPSIDAEIRQFWEDERIFQKSVEQRDPNHSFVFYEGPPSANGKPGIHHVMARTVKDLFCRYNTLRGYRVERKGGWDTHGLPIELQVEKELGITKEDIGKKVTVEEYNAACRSTVMRYKDLWDDITRRMGYWVDLDAPYITFENEYIETCWYMLQRLYKKQTADGQSFLYKGFTIQPYSPAAGTGLSSHELNMPGTYKEVTDISVVAQFKVIKDEKSTFLFDNEDEDVFILAWTTTPWTLPSNVALTVGPKIKYVKIQTINPYSKKKISVILADETKDNWFVNGLDLPIFHQTWYWLGEDLVGIRYEQLMPMPDLMTPELEEKAFRVIPGDWVTTEDGTGVVHTAPYFGADDFRACKAAGVPFIGLPNEKAPDLPFPLVDKQGKFVDEVPEFGGRYVKAEYYSVEIQKDKDFKPTDLLISLRLKEDNKAFKIEKYKHTYPHCWRTDKPVLYYPLDSWFVRASAAKERLAELNRTINWQPESTGTGRFGAWLDNLQNWNLSRSRYWGVPLPIWRTEDGEEEICVGSVMELQEEMEKANAQLGLSQKLADDLHRPYIDDIILVSPSGKPMRRELDLIDVWFDSGSMPYAQWGLDYEKLKNGDDKPFKTPFEVSYPATFIAEGVDQTRGWFYTLHAIAGMVYDSVAFQNVVSNGLVLDKNGEKMSKSKGNVVDPFETIAEYGADATRWYMMANANPWDNLKFDTNGIIETRNKLFGTLYNTYNFFALYANLDGFKHDESNVFPYEKRSELDRWVISKLYSLVADYRVAMDDYDVTRACRAIEDFVDEHLSNWYVRLSRRRFWKGEMNDDKLAAYQTLFECLMVTGQLMAPVAPFFSDWLYRNLTAPIKSAAKVNNTPLRHDSVHLSDLTQPDASKVDKDLEKRMDYAQRICSLALSIRKKERLRVRLPLQKILLPVLDEAFINEVDGVKDLILSEINVKGLEYVTDASGLLKKGAKANFKTLGAKLGKDMKDAAALIAAFTNDDINALEKSGGLDVILNGNAYTLTPDDLIVTTEDLPGWKVATDSGLTVALDVTLTDDLLAEGTARDLVNRIQNIRKDKDFQVTDRVVVAIQRHESVQAAVERFHDYIKAEVLATDLVLSDAVVGEQVEMEDGAMVGIEVVVGTQNQGAMDKGHIFEQEKTLQDPKVLTLWKPIEFAPAWAQADTSVLDDLSDSWFIQRQKLQDNSSEYTAFLERLKREHAIETGIIERLYDLSTGMTETFINEGFRSTLLSHGDTNIAPQTLMQHLNDHLEAVNWVFDIIKDNRPFSVSMVKQLHQLVTRHQETAEGRDGQGRKTQIPLLKGDFKKWENNPTRPDGVKVLYCPPEHVASEMDNLISIYNQLAEAGTHPLLLASWVHHAFTTIHPFQDGNGRVARLLASLIFVKAGFFPLTVLREEAKVRYIAALDNADSGEPQSFVTYLGEVQKRNIQKALNVQEVSAASSFEAVQDALIQKIRAQKQVEKETLTLGRRKIFSICEAYLQEVEQSLKKKYGKDAGVYLKKCSFDDTRTHDATQRPFQDFYFSQIIAYAQKHGYYFNRSQPKAWFIMGFDFSEEKKYHVGITLHHFGYEDGALAIGAFLEHKGKNEEDTPNTVLPLAIPPYVVSAYNNGEGKEANIKHYLEDALTAVLAQIASEL